MNFPGSSGGPGNNPNPSKKKEIQLQGPRPPQLRVNQDSRKIKKPPPHPQLFPPPSRPPLPPYTAAITQYPQPVIIYDISPKVIHVAENNFRSVVQRLTGFSSAGEPSNAGDLSPAARLASIEKVSPRLEREREREIDVSDMMDLVEMAVEVGQAPGILSPAPATLAPIPTGFFSPAFDPQTLSFVNEMSPYWHGNSFSMSPSALLSAPLVSPIASPNFFNNLFDL